MRTGRRLQLKCHLVLSFSQRFRALLPSLRLICDSQHLCVLSKLLPCGANSDRA
jgi:hypothetical protein